MVISPGQISDYLLYCVLGNIHHLPSVSSHAQTVYPAGVCVCVGGGAGSGRQVNSAHLHWRDLSQQPSAPSGFLFLCSTMNRPYSLQNDIVSQDYNRINEWNKLHAALKCTYTMFVFLHCVITEVWSQVFSAASCQGSCKDKNKSFFHFVQENNAHSPAAVFTQSFLEVVCKICKSKDTLKQQALSKCFSNQTFQTERLHDHVKVIRSDRMTT